MRVPPVRAVLVLCLESVREGCTSGNRAADKSVIHIYEENSEACHRSQRGETGEE